MKNDHNIHASFSISPQGLVEISPKVNQVTKQNIFWTSDCKIQLPIRLGSSGESAETPRTLIQCFTNTVAQTPDNKALSYKEGDAWKSLTYKQYYHECINFAKSLIVLGSKQCINIIGFNYPSWNIAFFGSIFARSIPVGIYTTNSQEICQHIANESDCEIVVAETYQLAQKYVNILDKGKIKKIVIYGEKQIKGDTYGDKIILWADFIKLGQKLQDSEVTKEFEKIKPGHCCSIIYTSGTTGMPKGVILSHDNYTWVEKQMAKVVSLTERDYQIRVVSYLPFSHVAAQLLDVVLTVIEGGHLYFAQPDALQGTLLNTLIEVKPTIFLGVPRVWEKIYNKLSEAVKLSTGLKAKLFGMAMQFGDQVLKEERKQSTSLRYKIFKSLVFNKIKQSLGLQEARIMLFGAAPLQPQVRSFFQKLGLSLRNIYGMSEATGPQTLSVPELMKAELSSMKEAGPSLPGTEIKIDKKNPKDQQGQICYRGRHIFMGYFKNPSQTMKTIDKDGYLHSGDLGYLDSNGVLFITGRLKELIITAGGENIAPLIIEESIQKKLPWIGNAIVVGEGRHFLTCLICLNKQNNKLSAETIKILQSIGVKSQTLDEVISNQPFLNFIQEKLNMVNESATSRAQTVRGFAILPEDLSIQNNTLTPSLKLRRKEIQKRYNALIQTMYQKSKL